MENAPDKAEQAFFGALLGEETEKSAAELSPATAEALGIPTVSPSILAQLEESAADAIGAEPTDPDEPTPEAEAAPAVEAEAQAETAAEGVEEGEYDPVNHPPPLEDEAPSPELPSRLTHGKLWNNKRAHPIEILELLAMRYGKEWVDWEPDTLLWALRRDFGPVGELTRAKVGALRLAVSTEFPWQDWDVFEDCGQAWNDTVPIVGSFQPLTPMQAAFTIDILQSIRPEDELGHEVRAYVAAILHDHGWVYAPPEFFEQAEKVLQVPPEALAIRGEVEAAWGRVKDVNPNIIDWREDSAVDIHLLKLAVVKLYLEERESLRGKLPGASTASTPAPPMPS